MGAPGKPRRQGMGRGPSGRRRGNGPPCRQRVAGLRDRPATLGLRYGPDSYGRQQWGILRNGGNPDAATPRAGRGLRVVNRFQQGRAKTVPAEEAPANYVPAAAVIRRGRALSGFIGRKARVGGPSGGVEAGAQPRPGPRTGGSSAVGEGGIPGVAVECADIGKNTDGEGSLLGRH